MIRESDGGSCAMLLSVFTVIIIVDISKMTEMSGERWGITCNTNLGSCGSQSWLDGTAIPTKAIHWPITVA